jgi:hypothetical protein
MGFNATFNNISVISWWSVFMLEETGDSRRKPKNCRKSLTNLSHNIVSGTPRHGHNNVMNFDIHSSAKQSIFFLSTMHNIMSLSCFSF